MTGRFVRDPRTLSRFTLDAVVVLPPDRVDAVVVGDAGPAVWALTRDPTTLEELTAALRLDESAVASAASAVAHLLECNALLELPAHPAA
jgi:hypothetical protein